MTTQELDKGAKAMHTYFASAIREQAIDNPHPFNTQLAEMLGVPWDQMRDDQRADWREMFRLGVRAVAHS